MSTTLYTASEKTIQPIRLPSGELLNGYRITNAAGLSWRAAIYRLTRVDKKDPEHEDRGDIKSVMWNFRKEFASECEGYGFIVDVDEERVAVPESWRLASGLEREGYRIMREDALTVNCTNSDARTIFAGIIRECLKKRFKENPGRPLGELWQDYDRFCQVPILGLHAEFIFCRRFGFTVKRLVGNVWTVQVLIGTATLDGLPLSEYYERGHVRRLAMMVEEKRAIGINRKNRPFKVRVLRQWCAKVSGSRKIEVLDILNPETIRKHAQLDFKGQQTLARGSIPCNRFGAGTVKPAMSEVRLIAHSGMTLEDHSETIIDPTERQQISTQLRDLLDGTGTFGSELRLDESPLDSRAFTSFVIPPPTVFVRGSKGKPAIVPSIAAEQITPQALRERARTRTRAVFQNGFFQQRPFNPLLAYPALDHAAENVRRLQQDLNALLKNWGIGFRFEKTFVYRTVAELKHQVEHGDPNTLFAVLPERSSSPQHADDTHEQIKQSIELPSQCICCDHLLHPRWVSRTPQELQQRDPSYARKVRQRYELCLLNLLVKDHWVPFVPAQPFNYNLHVGIDVGGRHNNQIMLCLGHGFRRPQDGLIFLPQALPCDLSRAEPIPPNYLLPGLIKVFETMHAEIVRAKQKPDFEKTLFFRDGPFLGAGERWNERDVLPLLHKEMVRREWISPESTWSALELHKQAEGWRLFHSDHQHGVGNPIVGQCVFPFDSFEEGLLCTTGAPFLTQGTASPLKFKYIDIYGDGACDEALQDTVWEADLCYSKLDTAQSLPWVLHVADTGALQMSRAYKVSGITT